MGMGTKEDESSTGRVCAAGFHHFMVRSRLARVFKLTNCLFLLFSKFSSGQGKPLITKYADVGVCLCMCVCIYGTVHSKLEKITVRLTYMFKHGEGIGAAYLYAVGI